MVKSGDRRVGASAETLGSYLATFRKLLGLTVQQVAERAGVSRGTVSRLEAGDLGVSLGVLLAVCRALGVTDMLMSGMDPYETALGRAQADRMLPTRVRRS